jgi:hypothetical protein
MDLPQYFKDISQELQRKSDAIRRDFSTHNGAAGSNRESLIAEALKVSLPDAYCIDTGLITSGEGKFSNQADLVITDNILNTPFYPNVQNRIFLVESVYALIEVKTSLNPTELKDALSKCRRFKNLKRTFSEAPSYPIIKDSLFILWAFESTSAPTVKNNLEQELSLIPVAEQPDFVIVPGKLIATCGQYRELSLFGAVGSLYRMELENKFGKELAGFRNGNSKVYDIGDDALLVWLIFFLSWLKRAGSRNPELLAYLPQEKNWGNIV